MRHARRTSFVSAPHVYFAIVCQGIKHPCPRSSPPQRFLQVKTHWKLFSGGWTELNIIFRHSNMFSLSSSYSFLLRHILCVMVRLFPEAPQQNVFQNSIISGPFTVWRVQANARNLTLGILADWKFKVSGWIFSVNSRGTYYCWSLMGWAGDGRRWKGEGKGWRWGHEVGSGDAALA